MSPNNHIAITCASYPERLRERPDETSATARKGDGANSGRRKVFWKMRGGNTQTSMPLQIPEEAFLF
jgi:hypothetical protein